jgi:hypothetical protein
MPRLPNGASAPKKKKPAPKRKPSPAKAAPKKQTAQRKSLPGGYKVPAKLMKNTPENILAAPKKSSAAKLFKAQKAVEAKERAAKQAAARKVVKKKPVAKKSTGKIDEMAQANQWMTNNAWGSVGQAARRVKRKGTK